MHRIDDLLLEKRFGIRGAEALGHHGVIQTDLT